MKLTQHDLEFILKQTKIAEANSKAHSGASAKSLTDIWVDADGNTEDEDGNPYAEGSEAATAAIGSSLLPYGLRTVDGSYNNFMLDREQYGSSGQPFERITDPHWVEGSGSLPPGYPENHQYGNPGDVVDGEPRLISNLIVDQTPDNPAAIITALQHAGYNGDISAAVADVQAQYEQYKGWTELGLGDDALTILKGVFDSALLNEYGIEMDGPTIKLPNVAPDDGISASYNAFFAAFGQFFDHGLDLVSKGGNGTVYMPLQPDDPLYVEGSHTNFMAMTRATVGEEARNITTPWVDQNQTYTSNPSHQVFLREYAFSLDTDGDGVMDANPVSTGKLLEGSRGLATWADVKEQAREFLGISLTDKDVGNVPVLLVDAYGEFVRGENGLPQVLAAFDPAGNPIYVEGSLASPIDPSAIALPAGTIIAGSTAPITLEEGDTVSAARTGHAFLDDIAHVAAPVTGADGELLQDDDAVPGYSGGFDARQKNTSYDNELLDAHYITGDGRGNENIGLSTVHHIFHSEHNHIADQVKEVALQSGDRAFLNEWLTGGLGEAEFDALLAQVQAPGADLAALSQTLQWDGERVFQAARFTTEMEYQHLVFEEFARKIQPDIDAFMVFPDAELNPVIFAEFADVVYRFGHSMLNETVPQTNADGSKNDLALFDAFLNPPGFGSDTIDHDTASGAIIRGMTGQVGNEIDEFVTNTLRNKLLGIPLDLAATNIARARDTGTPTLNQARAQFMEMAGGDTQLKPYESWTDFALNMKNPASIINFIAAYGTHDSITGETTAEAKRDAAFKLVMGGSDAPADRADFLNGTGAYAGDPELGGLQNVDLWVGGLAEQKMSFGGMLGSTFSFVFEMQLESLQDADRFYYLSRAQGLNMLTELESNSLAKMALRNTDLGETGFAMPSDIFSSPDHALYVDHAKQLAMTGADDPTHDDPILAAFSDMVERRDDDGDGVAELLRYNGDGHIVMMGSDGDDHIIAGKGDDTVWGGKGNDRIEGGYGVDLLHGGEGDDIITNAGTDIGEVDMIHGDEGNDVIHAGSGLALNFGGGGQDFIMTGPDGSEVRAGTGNDFIQGGSGADTLFGNEGDDWIEAGGKFDYIAGDNGDLFFNSTIIGHDVINGGPGEADYDADSGDDIMFASEGIQKFIGMWGHDWVTHQGQEVGADADMNVEMFPTLPLEVLRDRYSQVESVSGGSRDDVIRGDNRTTDGEVGEEVADPTPEGNFKHNELDEEGIARINGLGEIITEDMLKEREYWADGSGDLKNVFVGGNILLGGGGSDTIAGRGGNDVIDGDAYLNTRISVVENRDGTGEEIHTVDSMGGNVTMVVNGQEVTKPLSAWMLDGRINPGQLKIVREILYADDGEDTAEFWDARDNYEINYKGDGWVTVDHVNFDDAAVNEETGMHRYSDDIDTLRNIEVLRFGDTEVNVVTGTEGNDTGALGRLDGGNGEDVIIGLGGNDLLRGLGGDDMLFGGAGNDDLRGGGGNDLLNGGAGNDILDGGNGNDILVWETAGRDKMNGGAGVDTAQVLGEEAVAEHFIVYDRASAIQQGFTGLAADTEIAIIRDNSVIAELNDIEEIVIDGRGGNDSFSMQGNFTNTSLSMSTVTVIGSTGNDTIDISALQSAHRVVFKSNGGDDTIVGTLRSQDVVELHEGKTIDDYVLTRNEGGTSTITTEGHSITFQTAGGLPQFVSPDVGGGQPDGGNDGGQDHGGPTNRLPVVPNAVNLRTVPTGATLAIFSSDLLAGVHDSDGDSLMVLGLTASSGSLERVSSDHWVFTPDPAKTGEVTFDFSVSDGKGVVAHSAVATVLAPPDEPEAPVIPVYGDTHVGDDGMDVFDTGDGQDILFGMGGNDVLDSGAGDDLIHGGSGNDIILGGSGNDILFGEDGNDHILAGAGDDLISGGQGRDNVFGGSGNDTIVAELNDGDDLYFGDAGSDTLDMSAISSDSLVVLSANGSGSAKSALSGTDMLFSIENVRTGSGADIIIASEVANVMDGGEGADTFVFKSTMAADGDLILGFEAGDTLDLGAIDANTGMAGNQAFRLLSAGDTFNGSAGQLQMRWETDGDGRDLTLVEGDINGDGTADFQISLMGSIDLYEAQLIA
ncbi:heme peroxidase [Pollutimonas subterranea]|uniref:Heme peroxidase n=1 Tax=Pollutimonas subterranea TaxID=2045210 RepID=A0A2N4U7Z3_9BURK|nr:peroxidase family protein [Pollutimonas subterranea]PLC51119.1 heme peroxidase [Pollutimonas subterranea]